MDINKIKKVRNTLRLQFGGGISNQIMSLNDINQFRQNSLNLNYINNEVNKLQPIYNPTKRPSGLQILNRSIEKNNNSNILPLSNSINFENNEIPEKIELNIPKISRSQLSKDMREEEKQMKENDPEEYEKNYQTKNQSVGQITSSVGTIAQGIGQAINVNQMATDSNLTKGITLGYNAVSDGLSSLGPVGKAAGAIMKIAETTGDALQAIGGGTDQQSTLDKWMDSPLFSWNIGAINGFFGKNTDSFAIDSDVAAKVGGSYGGSMNTLNDAAEKAGKEYGLLSWKSRKKANDVIANAKATQNSMYNIADTASDQRLAVQSMGEQAGLAYSMMTNGGFNQKYTYAAKEGGLLEWHPIIELNLELKNKEELLEWVPEFKKGGSVGESDIPEIEETSQKNVIPEGALHKNKHHMEHAEGLTKKGIPVIDNDGEQQAEIEHSEIIFTLEVTKKLEEYYNIFYSDESSNKEKEQAAIDAGKLLVYQILENTDDRTNLIESCKDGGTLKLKKSTDDLIEEALEWIPQIIIIEEEIKEESKDKKKSEKEEMKETVKEVLIELLAK